MKKLIKLHFNLWDITLAWAVWKMLDWVWLNKVYLIDFAINFLNSL